MHKKSIVLVEDSREIAMIIKRTVSSYGYHVRTVPDGVKALNEIKELPPHLVLLDIMLPDIDGLDILSEIKKTNYLKHIPVVMVTSVNAKEKIVQAMNLGASDYIVKPINTEIIISKLWKLFNKVSEKEHILSVDNIVDELTKTKISVDARIGALGEMNVSIKSNFIFRRDSQFNLKSRLLSEIGMDSLNVKVLHGSVIHGGQYKCQNQCLPVGTSENDLEKLRKWVKRRIGKGSEE